MQPAMALTTIANADGSGMAVRLEVDFPTTMSPFNPLIKPRFNAFMEICKAFVLIPDVPIPFPVGSCSLSIMDKLATIFGSMPRPARTSSVLGAGLTGMVMLTPLMEITRPSKTEVPTEFKALY